MAYTTIDDPEKYFQSLAYTGQGGDNDAYTLSGDENLQPDLVWIKNRGTTNEHLMIDSVRGALKALNSNDATAEDSISNSLKSFNSDGFTLGGNASCNANNNTYASWSWKAGTSIGSTSTSGSGTAKTYTGSVNADAGFSIINYVGNGTAGHTIPHHLAQKPDMILVKAYEDAQQWASFWAPLGATKVMRFGTTNTVSDSNTRWNDTEPTSSVFTVGNEAECNTNNEEHIAYCFANKQGYLKVGSYKGNGNANGAFVYTGFRPAFLMYKNTTTADSYFLHDNRRQGYNDQNELLFADSTQAESTVDRIRFTANGFKTLDSDKGVNKSGDTYVYMAIAEAPLVNSNGVPNNAR